MVRCFFNMKKVWFGRIDRSGCVFCGSRQFSSLQIIQDSLASAWELSNKERLLFDDREGHQCARCGMSKRVRMLLWSIRRFFPDLAGAAVLHINQVGRLSPALQKARCLTETFYDPAREFGLLHNGLVNQDVTNLTLATQQFDLAIHSETLEHVHDYNKALSEIERVLKPGGLQIYTIPLLHARRTRRRIALSPEGHETPLLAMSFHGSEGEYPVVWELGGDFLAERQKRIFQLHYDSYWRNRTVFTVIERKAS